MTKSNLCFLVCMLLLGGCATSTELKERSANNDKAADYYESIGQPHAAEQERKMAQENREDSFKINAILSDILSDKKDK